MQNACAVCADAGQLRQSIRGSLQSRHRQSARGRVTENGFENPLVKNLQRIAFLRFREPRHHLASSVRCTSDRVKSAAEYRVTYNSAIDGLESLVLAHACAGSTSSTPFMSPDSPRPWRRSRTITHERPRRRDGSISIIRFQFETLNAE